MSFCPRLRLVEICSHIFGSWMRNIQDSLSSPDDTENVEQDVSGTMFRKPSGLDHFELKMSKIRRRSDEETFVQCGRDGESESKLTIAFKGGPWRLSKANREWRCSAFPLSFLEQSENWHDYCCDFR